MATWLALAFPPFILTGTLSSTPLALLALVVKGELKKIKISYQKIVHLIRKSIYIICTETGIKTSADFTNLSSTEHRTRFISHLEHHTKPRRMT